MELTESKIAGKGIRVVPKKEAEKLISLFYPI